MVARSSGPSGIVYGIGKNPSLFGAGCGCVRLCRARIRWAAVLPDGVDAGKIACVTSVTADSRGSTAGVRRSTQTRPSSAAAARPITGSQPIARRRAAARSNSANTRASSSGISVSDSPAIASAMRSAPSAPQAHPRMRRSFPHAPESPAVRPHRTPRGPIR